MKREIEAIREISADLWRGGWDTRAPSDLAEKLGDALDFIADALESAAHRGSHVETAQEVRNADARTG